MGKHLALALILATVVPVTATGQVATYQLIDPVVAGLISGSSVTTTINAIAGSHDGGGQGSGGRWHGPGHPAHSCFERGPEFHRNRHQ